MKIKLAGLRVNAGLTQEHVAEELHVSKSTVGKWENYKTSPTSIQLNKLCELYGCTLDDVYIPDKLSKERK